MKNFWNELKWQILIWSASLFFMLIVFPISPQKLSDIIQAQAVVTLVLITWYYAIQTKGLVDEQKRSTEEQIRFREETRTKTEVDFLERRIEEFFHPLRVDLDLIHDRLHTNTVNAQLETEILENKLRSLYYKKRYMTGIDNKSYIDLLNTIGMLAIDNKNNFEKALTKRNEYDETRKTFLNSFNKEWEEIENEIFSYYMPDEFLGGKRPSVTPPPPEVTP